MNKAKVILCAALIACGGFTHPASAQGSSGTLGKIKSTGEINIGYREAAVPFSYLDDRQKPVGFSMDVCLKVAEAIKARLGLGALEVKLTPVTAATRIPLIANGTIDLECGSTTNNVDRQRQVAFTNTHFLTATRFASKGSAKLTKVEDLKGKTVVATSGTTNIRQINELNAARNLGLTIQAAKDHAEGFLALETGRAVAFFNDDVLLASLIAGSKSPGDYAISSDAISAPEPYGIMMRRDDPEFKKAVDEATGSIYRTEGVALYEKWFTQPIPPRNINLGLPMSPAMRKAMTNPSDSPDPASY